MYIHPCSFTLTYPGLVTCKQFDPGQIRKTGADLDPNHLTLVIGIKALGPASRGLQLVRLGKHCRPRPDVASCSVLSDSIMFRDVPILNQGRTKKWGKNDIETDQKSHNIFIICIYFQAYALYL